MNLFKDRYDKLLIGFGSYHIVGEEWGSPMEVMDVPMAKQNSWEDIVHKSGDKKKQLITDELEDKEEMYRVREHRAIYNPSRERNGNYVPTVLPDRYDAFIYLNETNALHPPDTYSCGI